jgi:hypothetical protein
VATRQFNTAKQVTFALASTLTAVAKEAQSAAVSDIEETFTVRNNWDKPSNAMGVKVLPASKTDLSAAVVTRADWLNLHEEGGIKIPGGRFLAIPTSNVRRTKRDIVQRGQRPKALIGKRDFVIRTKKNGKTILFQRRGRRKNSQIVAMYVLDKKAPIKKRSTFREPVMLTVEKRFDAIFERKMREAFRTAR